MKRPIDVALDRMDFRCLRCAAKMGTCKCWEKVRLKCPACGRTKPTLPEPGDVVVDGVVELKCPDCWNAGT